jgi:hypothetical protein
MTADYVYSKADGSRSYAPRNYVGVMQYMPDVQVGATLSPPPGKPINPPPSPPRRPVTNPHPTT